MTYWQGMNEGVPQPISYMSGCKVAWYTFRTVKEAEIAAKWARSEAARKEALGYDFGWCTPGEISKNHKKRRYTVTFP
jgi:hypothetical protein